MHCTHKHKESASEIATGNWSRRSELGQRLLSVHEDEAVLMSWQLAYHSTQTDTRTHTCMPICMHSQSATKAHTCTSMHIFLPCLAAIAPILQGFLFHIICALFVCLFVAAVVCYLRHTFKVAYLKSFSTATTANHHQLQNL